MTYKIRSARLNNERRIWVRRPPAHSNCTTLVVFLDGELYLDRVKADSIIEDATSTGKIADAWHVFVSYESIESRWRECPCYPPFAQFVAEELIPWIHALDPAFSKIKNRILVGLSYTGLAAAFVAKEHPGIFQKVISQSGSFWSNNCWLIEQYRQMNSRIPTDFYLDVGLRETEESVKHQEDVTQELSQIEGVIRFKDLLLQKSYTVKYVEFDGGHDFNAWRITLPDALIWALPNMA